MFDPSQDGVTHINVYSKGNTQLGRFLSNFADCHIQTDDGYFRTIEGYWYWLSTKHEPLRDFPGWQCKKVGQSRNGEDYPRDPEFQEKISKAIIIKILGEDWVKQKLIESGDTPIVHYYSYGGKIVEPKDGEWIIELILHVREELKAGLISYP